MENRKENRAPQRGFHTCRPKGNLFKCSWTYLLSFISRFCRLLLSLAFVLLLFLLLLGFRVSCNANSLVKRVVAIILRSKLFIAVAQVANATLYLFRGAGAQPLQVKQTTGRVLVRRRLMTTKRIDNGKIMYIVLQTVWRPKRLCLWATGGLFIRVHQIIKVLFNGLFQGRIFCIAPVLLHTLLFLRRRCTRRRAAWWRRSWWRGRVSHGVAAVAEQKLQSLKGRGKIRAGYKPKHTEGGGSSYATISP